MSLMKQQEKPARLKFLGLDAQRFVRVNTPSPQQFEPGIRAFSYQRILNVV
jgi:hypothetical protein